MVELAGLVQGFFGIGHGFDHMPAVGQAGKQVMTQQRLIFHHQQFHKVLHCNSTSRQGDIIAALQLLGAQFYAIVVASQVRVAAAIVGLRRGSAQGLAPRRGLGAGVFEADTMDQVAGFLGFLAAKGRKGAIGRLHAGSGAEHGQGQHQLFDRSHGGYLIRI
ncbi:unnamed protein product, partial [Trypanosoma congolense IL3000]